MTWTTIFLTAFFIAAIAIFLLALLIEYDRDDLDHISYIISKLLYIYLRFVHHRPYYPTQEQGNVEVWRQRLKKQAKCASFSFTGEIVDVKISTPDGYQLPLKIFTPPPSNSTPSDSTAPQRGKLPVFVWLHGGGWVFGDVEMEKGLASKICSATRTIVVAVDYRCAPEYVYPTAVLDTEAALRWVASNIDQYGGDRKMIFVGGESAGGNLAAAVTSRNCDDSIASPSDRLPIAGAVLVYPTLASDGSFKSYSVYDGRALLLSSQMEHLRDLYSGGNESKRSEYAFAPILTPAAILKKYPPTIMVIAKYDVLSDECLLFVEKLREQKVEVVPKYYSTSTHGFFGVDFVPNGDDSVVFVANELQRIVDKFRND
eukprot:scaffold424_cov165-Ochromonas_danica.AAC.2